MSVTSNQQAQEETAIENKDGKSPPHEVTLEQALKLAQAHHRNGNLVIAERTYRDILRAMPDHFPTVHLLAAILFQRGNMDEATKFAKTATDVEPENASCWSNYAAILSANSKYDEALDAYDQALSIDPELCEAYVNKSHTLWLLGRFEEAEEVAAQATLLNPDKPEALINLGIALASQNKMDEAEEIWKQVVELDPNSGKAYLNWCNALRHQGELAEAKAKGLKATELSPKDCEAFNNYGCVCKDLGAYDEALAAFRKATDLKPDNAQAHLNTARTLIAMERFEDAIVSARYALSFKKDYADAYISLALAQRGLGQFAEARESADMAINLEPDEPFHYLTLTDILVANDQFDEADAVLQRALELGPTDHETLMKLAQVRRHLGLLDQAIEAVDQAIANWQETPPLLIEKARLLMFSSRVEEGLEVIEKALKLAPRNPMTLMTKAELLLTVNRKKEASELLEASREHLEGLPGFYSNLLTYKKYTKDDPDFIKLQEFENKLDQSGPDGRAIIHYALFEAYEQIGDYDKAFSHLKSANDAKKEASHIDPETFRTGVAMKKAAFGAEMIRQYQGYGCDSDVPVFIVGMPRSGTTLTEQIISSHPDVYGAGELYDLGAVVRERGPLTQESAAIMGEAYVAKLRARDRSGKAVRITDKMPGNYGSLGLIHCILPNAKIIHCRRNPLDNLLSCYKQNFADAQYWSYDLKTLAQQYASYLDIMEHWRKVLPKDRFIEVDYEETVSDFEPQARRLIEHVGLAWNDACLEPHKQKRAVLTASKDQVIQPIYKSSVESWKRYETQLQPLVEALRAEGVPV